MSDKYEEVREVAQQWIDRVKPIWHPPRDHNEADMSVSCKTATMGTIASIFGKEILGELTERQQTAIDGFVVTARFLGIGRKSEPE